MLRPRRAEGRPAGAGWLARSGADLVLVVLAAVGVVAAALAPPAGPAATPTSSAGAGAVCVAAVPRWRCARVPPAARAWLPRARRPVAALVLPLAATQAARRPQAGAAWCCSAWPAAAATFGLACDATWQRSQRDQADLRVGTDLALTLRHRPRAGDGGRRSRRRPARPPASAVTDRPVALGQLRRRPATPPPLLVAIDTRQAGTLLRGRLDGGCTWARLGAALAPQDPAAGVPSRPGRHRA